MADIWNLKYEQVPVQKILQTAALIVNYAPMLAVLFLAVSMRVTWLAMGRGNPQEWVQMWMYCGTYAVMLLTFCVCVIPLFTGEVIEVDQNTGDIKVRQAFPEGVAREAAGKALGRWRPTREERWVLLESAG